MRNIPFPLHGGSYHADGAGLLHEGSVPTPADTATEQTESDAAAEAVDPIVPRRRGKRHED